MALIPKTYINSVVAIGIMDSSSTRHWTGSGFLYGYLAIDNGSPEKNQYNTYLITNKHVVSNYQTLYIRFNPQTDQPAEEFVINKLNPDGSEAFKYHSNPEIDICVIPINVNLIKEKGLIFSFFTSDNDCLTIDNMLENEVVEGDFVYTLGFPMGIVAEKRQNVTIRGGIISRLQDLYEKTKMDFIVDAPVFPGNSGGPVILKPEIISLQGTKNKPKSNLIGIVKQYLIYNDIAYSKQTNQPRIIFQENSGLSVVLPMDFVNEIILDFQKKITK